MLDKTDISKSDLVYEIGAGKGIFTEELAKRCSKVIAIEIDKNLVSGLEKKFSKNLNIKIENKDFLQYPLPLNSNYKIFGSIPYNLTADIIYKLTFFKNPPISSYLVIQKEAAKKYVGFPFSRKNQLISILLKPKFEMKVLHRISRKNFVPQPKVDSVFLVIKKRKNHF